MPFICKVRTDIPDGILQVLDLKPNESQRNLIYEPAGQTKYINRSATDTVVLSVATTQATAHGLGAYLIDHVIDGVAAVTITAAVANATAAFIVATYLNLGAACTVAAINTALTANGVANAGAGTSLVAGGSDGTVVDVLKILAGGDYVLPAGSVVGALAAPAGLGAFTVGTFRHTYATGALNISLGEGHLSQFTAATFSWGGVAGAALVVYADDGSLL